jgi:hypothetical protein
MPTPASCALAMTRKAAAPDQCHGCTDATGHHPGEGVLNAFVLIRDRHPHPGQAPLLEAARDLDPEAARLDLADVQADHSQPGLVRGIGDRQRLG